MTVELRDIITAASVIVSIVAMLLLNRNAKRAVRPVAENADLTRIRDLRSELKDAKTELDEMKGQVDQLSRQLTEANRRGIEASNEAIAAYRERAEMIRYAHMPGVTIEDWLARFDPHEIEGPRRDR